MTLWYGSHRDVMSFSTANMVGSESEGCVRFSKLNSFVGVGLERNGDAIA